MRRPLLVPVAAAATVAAVVVALTSLGTGRAEEEGDVGQADPVVLAGTPDGTVPSVFGHTQESAEALLRDRGLEVRHAETVSCDPAGRPVGTEPATGTRVVPGETVTVLVSYQAANTDCAADLSEPWRFVDFATGRGPSPTFADEVDLFVDGVRTGTLARADAASGDWGAESALTILARGSEQVLRVGDSYRMPHLGVAVGTPSDTSCGVERPRAVGDREATMLTIDFAEPGSRRRCPPRVALYESAGVIDTVVAWSESAGGRRPEPIPAVVGLDLDEARDKVTAAGYTAGVAEQETCHPRPGVVEQAPVPSDVEGRTSGGRWQGLVTLVVEVPHTTRDCAGLDAAAGAFLRFARGGAPPAWAPEVQQLFGYAPWATVTSTAADDPATWAFCSDAASQDCDVSPLVVAAGDAQVATGEFSDVTRWPDGEFCEPIDRGGLPADLLIGEQIVMYPAEPASCEDDWSVWLWIDEAGRITAVNLLVPETTSADGG